MTQTPKQITNRNQQTFILISICTLVAILYSTLLLAFLHLINNERHGTYKRSNDFNVFQQTSNIHFKVFYFLSLFCSASLFIRVCLLNFRRRDGENIHIFCMQLHSTFQKCKYIFNGNCNE